MIVSEQIVLNEDLDLTQLHKGQHYALIREFFNLFSFMDGIVIFGFFLFSSLIYL